MPTLAQTHNVAILTIVGFIAMPATASSATNPTTRPEPQPADIADRVHAHLTATDYSGSMLVKRGDEILYHATHGTAHAKTKAENTTETLFETASVTKLLTALCILRLDEIGTIDLDDNVLDHLPDTGVKVDWSGVTVRSVLEHTSGLPRGTRASGIDLAAALKTLQREAPKAKASAAYAYSNAGYALLAMVIEHVAGKTYEQAVREHVLTPAGIADTTGFCGEDLDEPIAHADRGARRPANWDPYPSPRERSYGFEYKGMGGWCASTGAIAKLHDAITGHKIVGPEHTRMLWKPLESSPQHCLYHEVFTFPDGGQRCYGRGGAVSGFMSKIWWFDEEDTLIVMLSNEPLDSFKWSSLTGVKTIVLDD